MNMKEHLLSRGLNPEEYRCYYDDSESVAAFLLFTLTGKMAGYHTYRPLEGKKLNQNRRNSPKYLRYYTFLTKGESAVFGLEKYNPNDRTVYLTEGVFDACKLHSLGLNAFACFGNDPKHLRGFFSALNARYVGVLDGDGAGSALGKFCNEVVVCPAGKDPGDMTVEELRVLLSR